MLIKLKGFVWFGIYDFMDNDQVLDMVLISRKDTWLHTPNKIYSNYPQNFIQI